MRRVLVTVLLLVTSLSATDRARHYRSVLKHYTPRDRVTGRYQYVPFDIPRNTGTLRLRYEYDRANGENVVDLGLFEPGSLDLGTRAFRGYSGGSKSSVILSAAETTPGYRPGPLPPGEWHVLFGLYKVRDTGVDVTVTIETEPLGNGEPPPPVCGSPPPTIRSRPSGPAWFTGALHAHTTHSDGVMSPLQLWLKFRDAGFDFVAITDHNNTTHADNLACLDTLPPPDPLWIIGEEITTPAGHANVWGLKRDDWIDFRVTKGDSRLKDLVGAAHSRGALFVVNHPVSECAGCSWEHPFVEGIDGLEISNGRHSEVKGALAVWDELLRSGRRLTGVGSSDWHGPPNAIDTANVRVYAEALTTDSILAGLRAGRVIVMNNARDSTPAFDIDVGGHKVGIGDSVPQPASAQIQVAVRADGLTDGELVAISNGVRLAPAPISGSAKMILPIEPGYVRFELYARDGSFYAATDPIFLTPR